MSSFTDHVEQALQVPLALSEGQCGGSYYEATLLLSGIMSGLAASVWSGDGIDRRRLAELWARYADPTLLPLRVSLPLLVGALVTQGKSPEAQALREARRETFGPGNQSRVITGPEADAEESEVQCLCPSLSLTLIREFSYPNVFYRHLRSYLIHQYRLGRAATAWPMARRDAGVSYSNVLDRSTPPRSYRQIHFRAQWLAGVIRSVATAGEVDILSGPHPHPSTWWVDG